MCWVRAFRSWMLVSVVLYADFTSERPLFFTHAHTGGPMRDFTSERSEVKSRPSQHQRRGPHAPRPTWGPGRTPAPTPRIGDAPRRGRRGYSARRAVAARWLTSRGELHPTSVICVSPSLHLYTAKYRTLQEFQLANLGLRKSLMPPVLMFSAWRAEALPPPVLLFPAPAEGV